MIQKSSENEFDSLKKELETDVGKRAKKSTKLCSKIVH